MNEAYNKYCEWEIKHQGDKNYADEDNPYSYNVKTFVTEEESKNDTDLAICQDLAKKDCNFYEIENLYMRKHYWFIQYLYSLNMDQMIVKDGDVVKTFDGEISFLKSQILKSL